MMVGKRRTVNKTPRTPLSRRSEKETEELAVTPRQELARMGLCKEDLFMCSQPADSQIDVRWDCNSPEALLQLKRYRGQFLRSEVADIVKKLADETEDGSSTTEPLLGLWMSGKDDNGYTKPFRNNVQRRSDRRRRVRKPSCLVSDQCADELLEKLNVALHRHEDAKEEVLAISLNSKQCRVSPESPKLLPVEEEAEVVDQVTTLVHHEAKPSNYASKDLFESSEDPSCNKKLNSDTTLGISSLVNGNLQTVAEDVLEDNWSDDDLFANDSLLMKAATLDVCSPTPQPTSRLTKRKSLMNSPSAPLMKTKRFSEAPCMPATQIMQDGCSNVISKTNLPAKYLREAFVGDGTYSGVDLHSTIRVSVPVPYRPGNTSDSLKPTISTSKSSVVVMSSDGSSSLSLSRNQNENKDWKRNVDLNSSSRLNGQMRNGSCGIPCISASSAESNKTEVIPSSQIPRQKRNSPAGYSFKRHNTFPGMTVSPRNGRTMGWDGNAAVPHSGLATANKGNTNTSKGSGGVVSKPVTFSFTRAENKTNVQSSAGAKGSRQDVTNGESTNKAVSGLPKPFDFVPSPSNSRRRRSSVDASMFNTSLTDDLLCQLAEPDEILDSQFDMGVMEQTENTTAHYQGAGISSRTSAKQMITNHKLNQQNQLLLAKPEVENHVNEKPKISCSKKTTCTLSKMELDLASQGLGHSSSAGLGCSAKSTFTASQSYQTVKQSQTGRYHFKSTSIPKPGSISSGGPKPGSISSSGPKPGFLNPGAGKPGILNPDVHKPEALNFCAHKLGTLNPVTHKSGALNSGAPKHGTNSGAHKPGIFNPGAHKPGTVNPGAHKPGTVNPGAHKTCTVNPGAHKPGTVSSGTLKSCTPNPIVPKPDSLNSYSFKSGTVNAGAPKLGTHNPSALKPITNVHSRTSSSCGSTGKPEPILSTNLMKKSSNDAKDAQLEFNDSFMSDDELSNPEVMAMLDEVEIRATQASQGCKSPVFKCTPDEIQKKKIAAMERRKKNLQLQKKKPALRTSSKHYKPLF